MTLDVVKKFEAQYPDLANMIKEKPEKAFVLIDVIEKNQGNIALSEDFKKILPSIKNLTILALRDKGKNPEDLTRDKAWYEKTWDFAGKVLNFVPNLILSPISKVTTGKWINPVEGQAGSEFVRNVQRKIDPELETIEQKAVVGDNLTQEEAQKLDTASNFRLGTGLAIDLIFPSFPFVKQLSKVVGLTKSVDTLSDIKNAAVALDKITDVSDLKAVKNVMKGIDVKNVVKASDEVASEIPNSVRLVVKKVADKSGANDDVIKFLSKTNFKPDDFTEAKKILKSYENVVDVSKELKAIDTLENLHNDTQKIIKAFSPVKEELFKTANEIKPVEALRKAVVSDVPKESKPIFNKYRQFVSFEKGNLFDTIKNMNNFTKKIYKDVSKAGIKIDWQDFNKVLTNAVETKGKFDLDVFDTINLKPEQKLKLANIIKNSGFIDYHQAHSFNEILKESVLGVKVIPTGLSDEKVKIWNELIDKYKQLNLVNPFSQENEKIKKQLFDIYVNADRGYIRRALTDEAKEWISKNKVNLENIVNEALKKTGFSGVESFSKSRTLDDLTINQINKLAEQGELLKFGDNVFKGKLFKEDVLGSAIERGLKSVNVRGKMLLKNMFEEVLKRKEFDIISPTPKGDWVNISNILHLEKPYYVHPDVLKEIERILTIKPKDIIDKTLNVYDEILKFAKGQMTVGQFPLSFKFFIRNFIGNIFNSLLSSVKTKNLISGYIDTVKILSGKNVKLLTKDGKVLDRLDILRIAKQKGVLNTNFSSVELKQLEEFKKKFGLADLFSLNVKVGRELNSVIEDTSKLALFIGLLRQGFSVNDSANLVKKFLFDYSDLTRFENDVLKRIVPFYTWLRKNIPLQVENLFNEKTAKIFKAVDDINRQGGLFTDTKERFKSIDMTYLNDFLKENRQLILNKNKQKNLIEFLSVSGLLPQYDLNEVLLMFANPLKAFENNATPIIRFMLALADENKTEKYNTLFGVKMPKIWREVLPFIPYGQQFKYLETYNPFGIFGNKEKLSVFGWANVLPQKEDLSKLALFLIGTPAVYDAKFSKTVTDREMTRELLNEMTKLNSELSRISSLNTYAPKDFKHISERALKLNNLLVDMYRKGLLNDKDKIMYNSYRSLIKKLVEYKIYWDVRNKLNAKV